jgi:cytoskeleton protein RodZ
MTNDADTPTGPILTAGLLLREARLKAGIHVAVLSVNLKVPVRQLEALEANAFDADKGPVFYRGLASSVCRQLNLDPVPVLALLPRPSGQLAAFKQTQQQPILTQARLNRMGDAHTTIKPKVFWFGALLLALTLSFVWLPSPLQWGWFDLFRLPWSNNDSTVEVIQDIRVEPTRLITDVASSQAQTLPEPSSPSAVSLPGSGLAPVPEPSAVRQETNTRPNPAAGVTAATVKSAPWVFRASAESWLELRDAQNGVVWSGLLKAGDTTQIDSPLPVRVVVGRAQSVSVTLRGEAFDLKPHTQVTVARFEVKE